MIVQQTIMYPFSEAFVPIEKNMERAAQIDVAVIFMLPAPPLFQSANHQPLGLGFEWFLATYVLHTVKLVQLQLYFGCVRFWSQALQTWHFYCYRQNRAKRQGVVWED